MKRRDLLPLLALPFVSPAARSAAPAVCIAPAKPGGGFDLTCRLVRDLLRLPVAAPGAETEIRYMPGGIGAVAFDRAVSQGWSDPRTFIAFSTGSLVNLAQGKFGPHQPSDVRWLATLGEEFGAIVVRSQGRFQTLGALREALSRDASAAVFGAGGTVGSQDWIKAALLVRAAGKDHRAMRFVSFEGGGQALAALKGRHVDVFCGDILEASQAMREQELRLLAVLSPKRLAGRLGQVPTAREQGLDLVWSTVRGVYMGPGVGAREHAEWTRIMARLAQTREYRELLSGHGLQPHSLVGGELNAYVESEVRRFKALARELHLRVP